MSLRIAITKCDLDAYDPDTEREKQNIRDRDSFREAQEQASNRRWALSPDTSPNPSAQKPKKFPLIRGEEIKSAKISVAAKEPSKIGITSSHLPTITKKPQEEALIFRYTKSNNQEVAQVSKFRHRRLTQFRARVERDITSTDQSLEQSRKITDQSVKLVQSTYQPKGRWR